MYEYLDRQPQVGDVVEFIDNLGYSQNRLKSLHQVTELQGGKFTGLVPKLNGMTTPLTNRFKVVKTKPGNTAQVGDTIIRIANGAYPTGTIHTVYRNFGEWLDKNSVYYTDSCSIPHTDVLVLCKAQQKEQPMQITDYIIDIANSTLADRLVLRQVLLDNGQKVDSNMHTIGSKIYYMCTTWYCGSHINGHNISLADFINKFKKQDKLRNLAFYKRSNIPWTKDELHNIVAYVDDDPIHNSDFGKYENVKFVYDSATNGEFMAWDKDHSLPNFSNCLQVSYEDVFPITESTIAVGSHWQEMYTYTSKGPIVKVTKLYKESVSLEDVKTNQKRSISLSDFSRKFVPISMNSSQSESTKAKQTSNPFKVGDRVRSISDDNPTDRPYLKEFTVVKVYENDVYYKDGFAAHYSTFELVSEATTEPTESTIRVGSHWERSYNIGGQLGEIIEINEYTDNTVYYSDWNKKLGFTEFLNRFHPRPDLDNQPSGESTQVESTNQTTKEQPMTIQQLLQTLFGAEKPTTDYDKRPAILVVAYNRDGSQMGTTIANSIDQVKAKVADTPELWGCKVLTYTLDQEVSVDVPVKTTKAKVAKPAKE